MNSVLGGFDSHALPPPPGATRSRAAGADARGILVATMRSSDAKAREAGAGEFGYELRGYESGDEAEVLATFNRVFASIDPTFEPRDLATWRWLFESNPSGRRLWLAVTPTGRIVAQCAGIAQRVWIEGEPTHVSQSIDSMADPTFTAGLKRPGAFVRTCLAYWDAYAGSGPERDAFVWGWPVETAWRIGKSQLKYEVVRTQLQLVATPRTFAAPPAPGIDVEEVHAFPEDVRALFERVAPTSRCIAVRDAPQLTWRFRDRPHHDYRIALARRSGTLVGLTVFRDDGPGSGRDDGGNGDDGRGVLCEWLIDPDVPKAGAALATWGLACAQECEREELVTVVPDMHPEWLRLQGLGFRVEATRYFPVARYFSKRHNPRWLFANWYYTFADTDLV